MCCGAAVVTNSFSLHNACRLGKLASMTLISQGSLTQTVQKRKTDTKRPTTKRKKVRLHYVACLLVTLLAMYAFPGMVIRFCPWVQSALIFVHHVRIPFFSNLTNPAEFGLSNTRNLELFQFDGCAVSTWQVLPASYQGNATASRHYDEALSDGAPIVLYLHGNTGTRGTGHRVQVYKFLSSRGYHVVTFDYRGYGESSCSPSERGMMEDSLLAWRWVRHHAPHSHIYVWGHSLGSTAATYLAKELWKQGTQPKGIILDAPLTSMTEAVSNHPLGIPYWPWPAMPLFKYFVIDTTFKGRFESAHRLRHIPSPILIAHGHNDIIIPFDTGHHFFQAALESRRRNPLLGRVDFVDCGESTHKTNFMSPSLSSALDIFIHHK